jgi:transcriptional regulator GlxA family with amidase domain
LFGAPAAVSLSSTNVLPAARDLYRAKAPAGRFGLLLAWAREHLDAPPTVEDTAEQAGMSSRHIGCGR